MDKELKILQDENIVNNYPIFDEKGNLKFEDEIKDVSGFNIVGYMNVDGYYKALYSKKPLLILSDEIIEFDE
ncbi:hypothetical protein [Streptococcus gordonii]|jgi:hypothetical protein|uniref:hypothetical protein n=1 Tax=Streptococcus gordonii TaxID=1302 RepID=UPI001CBE9DB4|nr:hypothetical protein [Streptococcus gordonii]MBZ2142928.1 hypothetical protein [Streptococcus gordonii]MBZ2144973.1 hypothetical protein [Streptococcus gordonii]